MVLIEIDIYHVAGVIALACFGAWLRWRHYRKTKRLEAAAKFREVILSELKELYPEGIYHKNGREIVKLLREKHLTINAAVLEYRHYILFKKSIDKAWNEYSGIGAYRDNDDFATYNHYAFKGNKLSDFSEEPKALFLKNVGNLLKTAGKT